jgi:zinc protease
MIRFARRQLAAILLSAAVLFATTVATIAAFRREGFGVAAAPHRAAALDQPIVSELDYTLDSLPNGLRYYVRAHPSSSERTELRLVVDAGSVEETEDQRGLAHAVEHMVFRGTRSFPHGAIESYFESIGMRRGDDVNATTSMDDTEYRLTVPTTRAGAIDTAVAMLASIAHEASFDADDARREAGVLVEEWRSSRDADARVVDARRPLLFAGTAYAARPVLGDTGVLRRFDVGAMRRYYETWYRPELMAVMVVGDFDEKKVEAMVRRHFGAVRARGPRRARPALPGAVRPSATLRASVIGDPEARSSWIAVWHPGTRQRYHTRADYRAALVASLWQDVLRGRLEDAALQADSPLASIGVERRTLARTIAAEVVSVTAMKGQTLSALEATVAELRELAQRGPSQAELEERGNAILRRAREQAQDGDANAALAAEFVDHFLTGNAVFTSRVAYELAWDVLPTVTVDDVRAFARTRSADSGAVVVVAATADDAAAKMSPDAIVARARSARRGAAVRVGPVLDVRRLLSHEAAPGRIVDEQAIPEVRAYQWTLSNGMRVLLKPTSFTFDDIQLRAVAPGGASLASDEAYASAYLADAIIGETGVGRIPAPRLRRWLAATSMSLTPTVSDDAILLDGRTATADLEGLFQLLHLHLTSPRRDTVAFRRYQARMASLVQDRGRDPDVVFGDSIVAALAGGDPRALKNGASFYLNTRLDDALEFWTQRAANGVNFTVSIAGDFTLARVRPLVERYLASIPRGAPERPRARGRPIVTGRVRRDVASGIAGRARSAIAFAMPFELSNDNLNAVNAVREVVARALTERLRDKMGGTYYVDVSIAMDVVPPSRYTMTVEFESAPGRIETLASAAIDELARLHQFGPTETQFRGAREARVRDFDGRVEDNAFWVSELTFHARHGWPLAGIDAHRHEAEAMTLEQLRRACAMYIPSQDYVRVTMRPVPRPYASGPRR